MVHYSLNFISGTYPAQLEILFFVSADGIVPYLFCEGVGLDISLQTRKHTGINNGPERLLAAYVLPKDLEQHLLISRVQSNAQIGDRGLAIIGASWALHFERGVCARLAVVNTHDTHFPNKINQFFSDVKYEI